MKIFKKQISKLQIVELFVIIASICFLFWRCKYGYCFNDEPLFITFAERLFNGQVLYADEWHVAQNTGIVLLPFYYLFRLFSETNESVIMFFRYVYCLLWTLTCLYVFKTFKNIHKYAIVSFVFLVLFQPLGYFSMSYNSVGLMCSLCICCMLYKISYDENANNTLRKICFGFCWVALVLCTPLMAIAYIIFILVSLILPKHNKTTFALILKKYAITSLIVCLLSFVIYFVVIFTNITEEQFISFYNSTKTSHPHLLLNYIWRVPLAASESSTYFCIVCLITCLYSALKKKNSTIKYTLFLICCVLFFYYTYKNATKVMEGYFNIEVFNISVLSLTACVVSSKFDNLCFKIFGIYTFIYCVLHGCLSSNTGAIAFSMDLCVGTSLNILAIVSMFDSINQEAQMNVLLRKTIKTVCVLTLSFQLCYQTYVKLNRQYWDENLTSLNTVIKNGAAKGIVTNASQCEWYEDHLYRLNELLKSVEDKENKTYLCLTRQPVMYLDAGLEYNTFSAWHCNYDNEKFNNSLIKYYEGHNNNYPDIVFALEESDVIEFVNNKYIRNDGFGSILFIKK